jgi:3-oxoacyl-[acyl-carrier-protein] synthase-1
MRRVVVTGMGILSCIGNDLQQVLSSLQTGKSGIVVRPEYQERGMRSHVAGAVNIDLSAQIDRKDLRFMGAAAGYGHVAMQQAITDSGLEPNEISNLKTGIIMGAGGSSTEDQVETADVLREKGLKRVGPYRVTRTMGSTVSACLATSFAIKGINYSISSACATSAHCIGNAMELIQLGKQDIVFAGGAEAEHWTLSCMFDAMGALSTRYNDTPAEASRAYDANRDGFVIAGGGGVLVIEALDHALARGAKIYAELTGYGATSDGADMVAPSGEGAERCMKMAIATSKRPLNYINTHGTSTPVGDVKEISAIRNTFAALGKSVPLISSTKSLTGHSLGATGVQEAIYSILMMQNNFIAASANIKDLDPEVADMPIVQVRKDNQNLESVMSNSFGFGGTNATLLFEKYED